MKITIQSVVAAGAIIGVAVLIGSLVICMRGNGGVPIGDQHPERMKLVAGEYCEGSICHPALLFGGPITHDVADRINAALSRIRNVSSVDAEWLCLDSPGGNVAPAFDIANWVREHGLKTCIVPVEEAGHAHDSLCGSACMHVFLSGKRRVIKSNRGLGIHRAFVGVGQYCGPCNFVGSKLFWALSQAMAAYTFSGSERERQQWFIDEAMKYPDDQARSPGEVHWVTREEFIRWGLGDGGDFEVNARFVPMRGDSATPKS